MKEDEIKCSHIGCNNKATHLFCGGARSSIHLCDKHFASYICETKERLETFKKAGVL